MQETANITRRGAKNRSIESIPEFRQHLAREGITFQEWEQRNKQAIPDAITESLLLRLRYLKAKNR